MPDPLKPAPFHILLALTTTDRHGYGIMQTVTEQSEGDVRLTTGPFYRHLRKLMDMGLVEESPRRPADADPRRGAYYRLTRAGRRALAAETRRLGSLVALTKKLGLDPGRGS